jgi:glutamate-1-semialdehyde 2,1-aminomutase
MEEALETATRTFSERNEKSFEQHQNALESLPGGNTRSLLYTAPFPVTIYKGVGHKLFDIDGHESVPISTPALVML